MDNILNTQTEAKELKAMAFKVPLKRSLQYYREVLTIIIARGVKGTTKIKNALADIGVVFTRGQIEYYLRKNPITKEEISTVTLEMQSTYKKRYKQEL